jgi:hypothetical protein
MRPHVPQFWVSELVLAPPEHVDQADHVPLLQVRVWVPVQLHVWLVGPLQEQALQRQSLPQV